jgi:NAD(P)-dependent dehydrogenase (short-subunit alcohol dehydrogenase family)
MEPRYEQQQKSRPPQHQAKQPGREHEMAPRPIYIRDDYRGAAKLDDRIAIITGGDSGIGRAIAVHYAREGAHVAIVYLEEHRDAEETKRLVEAEGRRCLTMAGDVSDEGFCYEAVNRTVQEFGALDIVVNNAAEQHPQDDLKKITAEQLVRTFRTNIFAYFFMAKAALDHLKPGGVILNTTSVTAYRGSKHLLDYAATKGAIVAFTRSLALALADKGIRVNGVAPGPIWTPLIPATFPEERVEKFGADVPLGRAGQPAEVAPAYVYLASGDGSYMTGQTLHPNGGGFVET